MEDPTAVRIGPCSVVWGGNDLGFTKGGVKIELKTTTKRSDVDNFSETTIVEYVDMRTLKATMDLAEPSATLLATIMIGAVDNARRLDGGPITSIVYNPGMLISASSYEMRLHPLDRDVTDTSDDVVLPLAACNGNLTFAYMLDQERVFSIEFTCYPDAYGAMLYIGSDAPDGSPVFQVD